MDGDTEQQVSVTRLHLLQDMAIFGGVSEETLRFVLTLTPIVKREKGTFYFNEGDEADSMYVLEQGAVAVLKRWQDQNYYLSQCRRGDSFGEVAIMDLGRRGGSVIAMEPCAAIQISTDTLYKLYKRDLEQFTLIQMNIGREISRRLRAADERLFEVKQKATLVGGEYTFQSV